MTAHRPGLVVQHGATRNLVLPDGADPSDAEVLVSCVVRGRLRKGRREHVRPVVIGDRVQFTQLEGPERQGAIAREGGVRGSMGGNERRVFQRLSNGI